MMAGLALTVASLVGCGRERITPTPTRGLATLIAVPTPLPPLPTVAPLGSDENPLVVVFSVTDVATAEEAASALSTTFSTEAGLTIEVRITESYHEAQRALCDRQAGVVSLDAFSYLAVSQQGCGEARYVLDKGGVTATQGQFVARDVFLPQSYRGVFCRPDGSSLHGWVIPTLTLKARGVDTFTDLYDVVDAGSDEGVIRMIDSGTCGLGATTLGAQEEVRGLRFPDRLRVLEELPPVPNDAVVISSRLDDLTHALLEDLIANHTSEIAALLGGDGLVATDDSVYTPLRNLFASARVDPAALEQ